MWNDVVGPAWVMAFGRITKPLSEYDVRGLGKYLTGFDVVISRCHIRESQASPAAVRLRLNQIRAIDVNVIYVNVCLAS